MLFRLFGLTRSPSANTLSGFMGYGSEPIQAVSGSSAFLSRISSGSACSRLSCTMKQYLQMLLLLLCLIAPFQLAQGDDLFTAKAWRKAKISMDGSLTSSNATLHSKLLSEEAPALLSGYGLLDAVVSSFSMIIVSEIGDETFIIAALMAMRHPRAIVLSGALSALAVMTVFSTGLGRIVPNLISRKHVNSFATILYTFFGLRLLYIAWMSAPSDSKHNELGEVEEKMEGSMNGKSKMRRFFSRFCTPIFLESFVLTFLAEWGDRSQIATIALAAHKNAVGVTLGAIFGHVVCTSIAVVGGRLLALRISQRTVALIGGLLFICFALSSYFYPQL